MPVQLSPLQLEGYYVREFHFITRGLPEGDPPLALQFGLHPQISGLFDPGDTTVTVRAGGIPNPEDSKRLMAFVEIETRNPPEIKLPYDFRVVMVGYFNLNMDPPAADMERAMDALKRTAASVLYSAARELIAAVTGRGVYPAMVLPTVVITMDEPPAEEQPQASKKGGRKGTAKKPTKKGRKAGKKS